MSDDRVSDVLRVCQEALAREGEERATYLASACGADSGLRREVEALLAEASPSGSCVLDRPPWAWATPALSVGQRLGPYEVTGAIGAGGMGEVYKARDTRLNRTVAIKVLPAGLATDGERQRRFEHEARAVAALNHPHICALYDIGSSADATAAGASVEFLVMEYVEGQTLADRLTKGPLPVEQAVNVATEIAEALAAAHRQGVIHRDLKPANVMLTKTGAKLLDFGLAKLKAHAEEPFASRLTASAGPAGTLTAEGTIIGTVPYMAPEQVEGKPADARTDLWALGTILYEMLTGKRAFDGTSAASVIGAILEREPAPVSAARPLTPPALDHLVRQCLAKPPDDRPDTAHDVANELRRIRDRIGAGTLPVVRPRAGVGMAASLALAGIGLAALIGAGAVWLTSSHPATLVIRSEINVLPAETLNAGGRSAYWIRTPGGSRTALTWTPDGRSLVFVGRRGGVQQLYVRSLDALEARPLSGTEGAQVPAVSADGQSVVFWAPTALKKVRLDGGPVTELATGLVVPPNGLLLDAGDRIFFGKGVGPLWQLPDGGAPSPLTTLEETEITHIPSALLPNERGLLYTARKRLFTWGDEEVVAWDLKSGVRKVLLQNAADARYVATGHLLFLRRNVLFAVPFDLERLEVRGSPIPVAEEVAQSLFAWNSEDCTGSGQFAVASNGSFAWIPGTESRGEERRLVSLDRRGRVSVLPAPPQTYAGIVRASPDGTRLAMGIVREADIGLWLYDLGRGTFIPLHRTGEALHPLWSLDGQRVFFDLLDGGRHSVQSVPADASASSQTLATGYFLPSSWASGNRLIGVLDERAAAAIRVGSMPGRIETFLRTGDQEYWPELSPDRRWLAYGSDASGRMEIYVQPYPGPAARTAVSVQGGASPAWHPGGRELFFLSPADATGKRRMMSVGFEPGTPPRISTPHALFEFDQMELMIFCGPTRCFDVAPDGERFYTVQRSAPPPPPVVTHIDLVQNWFEELRAKVPVR